MHKEPSGHTPTSIARTIFYKSIANRCRKKGPILWFIQYPGRIVKRETERDRGKINIRGRSADITWTAVMQAVMHQRLVTARSVVKP